MRIEIVERDILKQQNYWRVKIRYGLGRRILKLGFCKAAAILAINLLAFSIYLVKENQ